MANSKFPIMDQPEEDHIELPPGFRFHPTDEELITHYLSPKVVNSAFTAIAIGEADLNKSEPWDLPGKSNSVARFNRRIASGTREIWFNLIFLL